jgi:hypothetical protein
VLTPTPPPPHLVLELDAPRYSLTATPTVTAIFAAPSPADMTATLHLDVDLNGDGTYSGNELNVMTVQATSGQPAPMLLPALSQGSHDVRVRLTDHYGVTYSSTASINVTGAIQGSGMIFEPNQGQTDPQAAFLSHGRDYNAFFTPDGLVLGLRPPAANDGVPHAPVGFEMDLAGATATSASSLTGQGHLSSYSNYFIGNDSSGWLSNVPNFAGVTEHDAYPNIDVRYEGVAGQLQMNFIVHPGGDPTAIALDFSKWGQASLDPSGQVIVRPSQGAEDVVLSPPALFQLGPHGQPQTVSGKFVLLDTGAVGFQVGAYDPSRDLIIDPTLIYSTYLGGTTQVSNGAKVAVDSSANAYLVGSTFATDFPTINPFQPTYGGGLSDAVITKLTSAGVPVYSTYLGGSQDDHGNDIAVDSTGSVYVVGNTTSSNFPTTSGAFSTTFQGTSDGFVTRLNPAGTALVYSGLLGSSGTVNANGVAIDASGNAFVASEVSASDGAGFPTTPGVVTPSGTGGGDIGALTKINPAGSALVYSTFIGPGPVTNVASDVVVDGLGNAYVCGDQSGFGFPTTPGAFQSNQFFSEWIVKLNPTASAFVYSTELAAGTSVIFTPPTIAVDSAGQAVVTGQTDSNTFPTTPGTVQPTFVAGSGRETFITKLNATGTGLIFSTFLGGTTSGALVDEGDDVVVDGNSDVFVVGTTAATDFPTVLPLQADLGGHEAYVAVLNPSGTTLQFSTYLGGSKDDSGGGIALDSKLNMYVVGTTSSTDFPVTPNAFMTTLGDSQDAFAAAITTPPLPPPPTPTPTPTPGGPGAPTIVTFGSDIFEPNETSDTAFNFGSVSTGSMITLNNLTIADHPDGLQDYDWFKVTAFTAGTFTARMTVTQSGPLELHLWVQNPSTGAITEVSQATVSAGGGTVTLATPLLAGQGAFVEAKGSPSGPDTMSQGEYNLQMLYT